MIRRNHDQKEGPRRDGFAGYSAEREDYYWHRRNPKGDSSTRTHFIWT